MSRVIDDGSGLTRVISDAGLTSGVRALVEDQQGPVPAGSPQPVIPGGFTDNSTIIANNFSVPPFQHLQTFTVSVALDAAIGGTLAMGEEPLPAATGVLLPTIQPGTFLTVEDFWDVTSGAIASNGRIWIRFDNDVEWWPMRYGSLISGNLYQKVWMMSAAQANIKVRIKGWTDQPLNRADTAGT